MGPLDILYSWQAILCALASNAGTQLLKSILDLKMSKEKRNASKRIHILLQVSPLILGAVYAMIIPWLPEPMLDYLADHDFQGHRVLLGRAAWGAACGQFAAFIFDKVKGMLASHGKNAGPYSGT